MKHLPEIIECRTKEGMKHIETLARDIWREHYTPIIGKAQVAYMLEQFQSLPAMEQQLAEGYRYFSVLENGRLVGYFSIRPDGRDLFLSKFYMDKAHRGKGYGRASMRFIEQLCGAEGYTGVRLTVNKYNQRTIDQYLHMGFEIIEDVVMEIGQGYVMDDHVLYKVVRS